MADFRIRRFVLVAGFVSLGLFGWLSLQVYRAKSDPEHSRAWDGPQAWIVGPAARDLDRVANDRMKQATRMLNDTSRPPAERLGAYRSELGAAEALLVRGLRAQPAQARVLARLAAVRWELDPPPDPAAAERHVEMIRLAAEMAPRVPQVRKQLGELLLQMNRPDEARVHLRRAVELDASLSDEIVRLMWKADLSAEEILASLPRSAESLVALQPAFLAEAGAEPYLDELDRMLTADRERLSAGLIAVYGNTCLQIQDPLRLRDRMQAIGTLEEATLEAERLKWRSRSHLVLRQMDRAVEDAETARRLCPDAPGMAEFAGQVLHLAGDDEGAVRAFRDALGLVVRGSAEPEARARLYSSIGGAEESRGNARRAYDAYRMALQLDPAEPRAGRRIDEMRAATIE